MNTFFARSEQQPEMTAKQLDLTTDQCYTKKRGYY